MSDTARSRSQNQVMTDDLLAKDAWNNVFPELSDEVLEPRSVLGSILAVL